MFLWLIRNFKPSQLVEALIQNANLFEIVGAMLKKAKPEELEQIAQMINRVLTPPKMYNIV
jgi:hypothetical protein